MLNADREWYNRYQIETENVDLEKRTDMSFAAIAFFRGHLVGMADRKSTNYIAGVPIQDPDRGDVTKMWSGKKMILAMTGSNCFFMDDPDDAESCRKVFFEDIMEEMIRRYPNPEDLCGRLFEFLRKNAYSEMGSVTVIAFYEKDGDVYSIESTFDARHFDIRKTLHHDFAYLTAGVLEYQKCFIRHNDRLLTLNEVALKENLDMLVRDYEMENPWQYNPVGNGWDVIILSENHEG